MLWEALEAGLGRGYCSRYMTYRMGLLLGMDCTAGKGAAGLAFNIIPWTKPISWQRHQWWLASGRLSISTCGNGHGAPGDAPQSPPLPAPRVDPSESSAAGPLLNLYGSSPQLSCPFNRRPVHILPGSSFSLSWSSTT